MPQLAAAAPHNRLSGPWGGPLGQYVYLGGSNPLRMGVTTWEEGGTGLQGQPFQLPPLLPGARFDNQVHWSLSSVSVLGQGKVDRRMCLCMFEARYRGGSLLALGC